ncbi:MAG TPA: AAA family ATPase, partial [Euzebya sp.]|nr:AAA family ATPase [Euzebya sp.]
MTVDLDPFRPDRVTGPLSDRMQVFSDASVLSAVDVHTALRLAALTGTTDDLAVLAAAFAVRAPRYGHVFAQLDALSGTVTDEDGRAVEVDPGMWPDIAVWASAVGASPLVTVGEGGTAPLHLDGTRLYLDRYWRHEHGVAAALQRRASGLPALVVPEAAHAAMEGLFAGRAEVGSGDGGGATQPNAEQRDAAVKALSRRLSVVAGGPGTGKTATIASIVAVALDHVRRPDGRRVRVAVAAPTGKAAARLGEAMRQSAATMPRDHVDPGVLADVEPRTIHRLLGGTHTRGRFRHDADNCLDVDLVVVDEVSMVPLGLLGQLLDAVPPQAAVVLVGDPDQLASVEAGTVLGDLVADAVEPGSPLQGNVVTLQRGYRFDAAIAAFADAIRGGDGDAALDCLTRDPTDLAGTPLALVVP